MDLAGSFLARLAVFCVFLFTAIATNAIHVILLVCVKPFSRKIYYRLVHFNNWTFMAQAIFFYQYWSSSEVTFYCKREDYEALKHEKVLLIANHLEPINILIMMVTLNHFNRLGNDISFGMSCFRFIPFLGWHIWLAGHILLKKSTSNEKKTIENRLNEIRDNPNCVWVVLLPEGDQFSTENHFKTVNYALKMGKQPLMHHLTPRFKAFAVTYEKLKELGGYSIVNVHVEYERSPKFSHLLRGTKIKAHICLERLSFDEIEPNFDGIYKLFQRHDDLHEKFSKFKNFNESGVAIRVACDGRVLINFIIWTIFWVCVVARVIYGAFAEAYKAELEKYPLAIVLLKMTLDFYEFVSAKWRNACL